MRHDHFQSSYFLNAGREWPSGEGPGEQDEGDGYSDTDFMSDLFGDDD